MTLPGFTAEAALSTARERYWMAGAIAQAGDSITPAFRSGSCYRKCLQDQCYGPDDPYCEGNCRCICYGRPGKTCWLM